MHGVMCNPLCPQELEVKKAAFLKSLLVQRGLDELPFDHILQTAATKVEVEECALTEWRQACRAKET